MNIFGGMKILWIFFSGWGGGGGSSQNWTSFRMGIFWGCLYFKYFLGVRLMFLIFLFFFFFGGGGWRGDVNNGCWVQAYV